MAKHKEEMKEHHKKEHMKHEKHDAKMGLKAKIADHKNSKKK